jgi:hypothetical protein
MAIVCATLAMAAGSAQATTVIPLTFDELVSRAELIFQGTVVSVRSEWAGDTGRQKRIVSYVTLSSEDVIKGETGPNYTLRMLGGTIGERTVKVSDAPEFKQGDRVILFVEKNGTQFIPLVGIMHGCFRVDATNIVRGHNGQNLSPAEALGPQIASAASLTGNSITADQFKAAIRSRLAR